MRKRLGFTLVGLVAFAAANGCNPIEGQVACPDDTVVFEAENVSANLVFVLDRSGSMHLPITSGATRWLATREALFRMFDDLEDRAHGDVTMFPNGDAPLTCCPVTNPNCGLCNHDNVPGPENRCFAGLYSAAQPSLMTEDRISEMKQAVSSSDEDHYWGTPLVAALTGAHQTLAAHDSDFAKAVVLLTDGKPAACATKDDPDADDIELAETTVADALEKGVQTYVVGVVDGDAAADAEHLSRLATAGGTARYPNCFTKDECAYTVTIDNFETDVAAALADIAAQATSCTFTLGENAVEAPILQIQTATGPLNVAQDGVDGWAWVDAATIELNGESCEAFKATPGATVQVQTGCAGS